MIDSNQHSINNFTFNFLKISVKFFGPFRIIRWEVLNFLLRNSILKVNLLEDVLQWGRFNFMNNFQGLLDVFQNNLPLIFIRFLKGGLDNIVAKFVRQKVVEIDISRWIDMVNHKHVVFICSNISLHWYVNDFLQNFLLELLQLFLSLGLWLTHHLNAIFKEFAAVSIQPHADSVLVYLLEDEFSLRVCAVLQDRAQYKSTILVLDQSMVFLQDLVYDWVD